MNSVIVNPGKSGGIIANSSKMRGINVNSRNIWGKIVNSSNICGRIVNSRKIDTIIPNSTKMGVKISQDYENPIKKFNNCWLPDKRNIYVSLLSLFLPMWVPTHDYFIIVSLHHKNKIKRFIFLLHSTFVQIFLSISNILHPSYLN